ncbi:hypothetical protein [Aliigemmobacter aestuarii]|uniref:hypothetical protein n=1 Tax=Aliigemmobacter aestuarii TaxID=1445661 RepID=UPI001B3B2783|nr:hypothetical protein [Gemmobacter aestuarii]
MKAIKLGASLISALVLAGCVGEGFEGTERYSGPNSVIATGQDQGRDTGVLVAGRAAIAYDPDGCQNWIIDDGLEGYSSPRYDPRSGLPVCNNRYPPGTVIANPVTGTYQTGTEGIQDRVSGPGIDTVVNRHVLPPGTRVQTQYVLSDGTPITDNSAAVIQVNQ